MTRQRHYVRFAGLLAACVALCGVPPAWSASVNASGWNASDWLAHMQDALAHRSYRGILVFMGRGAHATYRVVVSNGTYARLTALNGPRRKTLRGPEVVVRMRPGGRTMVVRGMAGGASFLPFPPARGVSRAMLEKSYRLALGGTARIAGRRARVLSIVPRDRWRYGYRVWIGAQTGLPLRTQLVTAGGKVLQQAFFTHLELLQAPAAMSAIGAHKIAILKRVSSRGRSRQGACYPDASRFHFRNLPPGFHVIKIACEAAPASDTPVTHVLIGDGLATVSLFLAVHHEGSPALVGTTTMGAALHAAGRLEGSFALTAMGDAPLATVRRIARGLVITAK